MANPINNTRRSASTTYNYPQFNTILNRPEAQNIITSLQRQMPNAHPRDIAMRLAQQKGIDINPLMRRFNLK